MPRTFNHPYTQTQREFSVDSPPPTVLVRDVIPRAPEPYRWLVTALALLTLSYLPGYQSAAQAQPPTNPSPHATLDGRVHYQADPANPWRFQRYYVKKNDTGELAEAVVTLTPVSEKSLEKRAKPKQVTMDQINFQFVPETVAVQVGDSVRFTNSDDSLHNVLLPHPKESFNENMGKGEHYDHTFQNALGIDRPHRLSCVYHGSMRAWVFVFNHRFFQVTSKDGTFQFTNVPPGKYTLEIRHPAGRLKSSSPLTLKAGEHKKTAIVLSAKNQP